MCFVQTKAFADTLEAYIGGLFVENVSFTKLVPKNIVVGHQVVTTKQIATKKPIEVNL